MIVQSAYQAFSRLTPRVTESLSRPKCPRCDSVLLIAEESRFDASAYNTVGRIDHNWFCDDCGNTFTTSIRLPVR
jgi:transposase-like protein